MLGYGTITISDIADGKGLSDSVPFYLASEKSTGVTISDPGWSRTVPKLTSEKKYLWVYYVSRYGVGQTDPELISESGADLITFDYNNNPSPLEEVIIDIEPEQTGSGTPSTSNVRSITGYKGVEVWNTNSATLNSDKVPYTFRQSGGGVTVGDREKDTVVGATVGWNQLTKPVETANWTSYGGTLTIANEIISLGSFTDRYARVQSYVKIDLNHKYLASIDARANWSANGIILAINTTTEQYSKYIPIPIANTWYHFENVINITQIGGSCRFIIQNNEVIGDGQSFDIRNPQLIDLTTLFGPTIADYIYQLEQATAGAGVAFFRKLFPKDYYPYCEPTLMSAKPTSHDMVGFNAWDGETESGYIYNGNMYDDAGNWRTKNYVRVVPNATYYFNCSTSGQLNLFDDSKNYIGAVPSMGGPTKIVTMPSNCHYVKFYQPTSVSPDTVCINLSWSGYRNGEYEPYKKHSYPLGGFELRGILKLDSTNNLYADGDRYTPDGLIERRFALVDLGTLNYSFERSDNGNRMFTSYLSDRIKKSNGMMNLISTRFYAVSRLETLYQTDGGMWVSEAGNVSFSSGDYSNVADFKAAMSGVMLLYELAEPTTEESTPYAEVQIVDAYGTEEYVTDASAPVAVPVGHETQYFTGNMRTVTWGTEAGMIYGGSLNVTTGVLTVTYEKTLLNGTQDMNLNGTGSTNSKFFYTPNPTKANGSTNYFCDKFSVGGVGLLSTNGRTNNGGMEFCLPSSVPQTADDCKAWFAANPTTIVYELATPKTYQLTPNEVLTLSGTNNVWVEGVTA